jgi:type I restriction enzyme, S subunit
MTRPNLNAVAIVPANLRDPIGSTGFDVLRTRTIEPSWLFYLVQTTDFVDAMSRLVQGALYPAVRPKDIRSYRIPLAPLNEQHRIIEAIEEQFTRLDAAVAGLERVRANLRRYRAAVLKAACEGRLVPTEAELARAEGREYEPADRLLARILEDRRARSEAEQLAKMPVLGRTPRTSWQARYEEPATQRAPELLELPEGWSWTNLKQLKAFSLYGPRFSSDAYSNHGKLVLRTSDISQSGKVNLGFAPRLPLSQEDFSKYKVQPGDLLITRTGSLGTLAVFNDTVEAIPGAYLIQYRLTASLDTSWYVFYFLKSPRGQRELVGGGAGVGRPNLNAPTIDRISIPLPPIAEQRRIVEEIERRLSVVDQLEATVEANLKRAERMRQAILKRAFEGKLVPQDSNDEPASMLLERTRAGRQAAGAAAGARGRRGSGMRRNGQVPLFDDPNARQASASVGLIFRIR